MLSLALLEASCAVAGDDASPEVPPPPAVEHVQPDPDRRPSETPGSARERQLRDEQRALEGRIQSLDRELAPYDRDRLRPPPDSPGARSRDRAHDPLAERRDLERRSLLSRERMIEQDLRREQFNRSIGRTR